MKKMLNLMNIKEDVARHNHWFVVVFLFMPDDDRISLFLCANLLFAQHIQRTSNTIAPFFSLDFFFLIFLLSIFVSRTKRFLVKCMYEYTFKEENKKQKLKTFV